MRLQLVTVSVRFRQRETGERPSDAQLDALADVLIGIEELVTVRVHPEGDDVVYRVDVPVVDVDETERLSTHPVGEAERQLGLVGSVGMITVGDPLGPS